MNLVIYLAVIVGACGQLHHDKDLICKTVVLHLDCSHFETKTLCGNYNQEFHTECDFAKAHCNNNDLRVTKVGPCDVSTTKQVTTKSTTGYTMSTKPVATMSTKPVATMSTKPVATMSTKPVATTTTKPVATMSTKPVITTATTPVATTTTKPVATMSTKPVTTTATTPIATTTTKPVATMSTKPVTTKATTPVATTTTKPVSTTSSKPIVTTTDIPTTSTQSQCSAIASFICNADKNEVCGTDGQTYDNLCKFEKARCAMPAGSLDILHNGRCKTDITTTTTLPITSLPSAFQIICNALLAGSCPVTPDQLCGSDGKTYNTPCDLEKAKCHSHAITAVKNGPC